MSPAAESWQDPKRRLWLLGTLVPPCVPLAGYGLYLASGHGAWLWAQPLFIHLVLPLLDWLIGADTGNPPEDAVRQLEDDVYYRTIVALYVPLHYGVFLWGLWLLATADLALADQIGLALSLGAVGGIGINAAHELGHKHPVWERWLAKIALAPVAYGHFCVEHNRGHHANVATPQDPASARHGEGFWRFLPRTMLGSVRSAWAIEARTLARRGHGPWHWHNQNLQAWSLTLLLWSACLAWLGPDILPLLLLQAVYGISLLEVVNYVEHYGLLRGRLDDGQFERCRPEHSWNSNHVVTNLMLFNLQRHSDHHAHPTRRYQALRHFPEAPQLPSGYASMITLAYVPPLWFAVMDPRLSAHYGGNLSLANRMP